MQHLHPGFEVVIPPQGASSNASKRTPRPLSVEEALQFSPMTSAPVFGLDSILRPQIDQPSLTNWKCTHDSQAAGRIVDELDNDTQADPTGSKRVQITQKTIQKLLADAGTATFDFKIPPRPVNLSKPQNSRQTKGDSTAHERLGPFAKMMLDATQVSYRYPTTSNQQKGMASSKSLPTPSMSKTAHETNERAFKNNQSQSEPPSLLPATPAQPIVLIPALPNHSPDDYQYHSPKRQRLSAPPGQQAGPEKLRDQKEVTDAAVMKLQSLLQDIFDAEDQLQPGDPQPNEQQANIFFQPSNSIDDDGSILSSECHKQLHKAFLSVSAYGKISDIPTEFLTRIQKLCESPIISSQSLEISVEADMSDSDVDNWDRQLSSSYNTLLAISTLLYTMAGRTDAKELCSENLIQLIPAVLDIIFDKCILPAVECRPNGKDAALFKIFSNQKQTISSLAQQARKVLSQLSSFLSSVDIVEGAITALEFLAAKLIFVENAFHDTNSAIGFQKYESVRRSAMDMLAKIFAKYPDQRSFILDEILVSLEKLPSTRQSARQFKITDGKSIQLLSALVVQLVQTIALRDSSKTASNALSRSFQPNNDNENSDSDESGSDDERKPSAFKALSLQVDPVYDNAVRSAQYITRFIVQRAISSTKTGDQPYRNILDIFTEDLIGLLGSAEWPGAELLLRVLASQMVGIAEHDKSTANAKNMALELLGWMGSAISDLTSSAQHINNTVDEPDSELTKYIKQLFDCHLNRSLHVQDLIIEGGPYRITLEQIGKQDSLNSQVRSARDFLLISWAKTACIVYNESIQNENMSRDSSVRSLASCLAKIVSDPQELKSQSEYDHISVHQARFAYLVIILSSGFCKAFDTIVKVLLSSISSDQAKVRSRSLKSVIHMLERDPSLLDRDDSVMDLILRCASDSSPMVRDSALTLIARCMSLKPALESECYHAISTCASDPTAGVRKRCIGLMKETYLQSSNQELKILIMEQLLQRVADHEPNVVALARQTLEELWISPLRGHADGFDTPQSKVLLGHLVDLLVGVVQRSDDTAVNLESFLKIVLASSSKTPSESFKICQAAVATLFERVVHDSSGTDQRHLQSLLRPLTVFAKSNAKLLTPDQLETLHPYIGHLSNADDLLLFRSVVVIYRCVLPHLSAAHNNLLKEIQNDLFKSVSKLARSELNEVMACLWTINGVLQNTERLVKLTVSVLKGIKQASNAKLDPAKNSDTLGRIRSYIRIAGCVGKHCDLEKFVSFFAQSFPDGNSKSVSGLMIDFISPFVASTYPTELRVMALESLGSVCETWPEQFGREQARVAFTSVFEEDSPELQNIVLMAFLAFFSIHEGKAEKLVNNADANGASNEGDGRLGGSLKASANDGAAALIAQNFLPHMLHAAVSKQDAFALTAIELIASINRQGLIHPKECAGVLVSLETSPNAAIAKTAYGIHKMLHQQHESMFEREYMRAVQDAFHYQQDVIGDPAGATARPFTSKLSPLFDIVKTSSSKYQKKFLTNFCQKGNFELKKLDVSKTPPESLLLTRFACHNLAFFEYAQVAEVLAAITCMERIVGTTGTGVAHAIETELFPQHAPVSIENELEAPQPQQEPSDNAVVNIDPGVLKQLTTAAGNLLMLWETRSYLRRVYGLNFHSAQKEAKVSAKELNKPATKIQGITGDKFWDAVEKIMSSFENSDAMAKICREFSTLMSIDDELKVAGDDERNASGSPFDVNGMSSIIHPTNTSKTSKRKGSFSSVNTTPKKKKKKRRSKTNKKRASTSMDSDSGSD
ncbi:Sister chromatid cohesion protein 2 [Myotisia sp. PD_48]|nr:Sister chromatid cohesion protein 2 [Myotisia sp. PD_48]